MEKYEQDTPKQVLKKKTNMYSSTQSEVIQSTDHNSSQCSSDLQYASNRKISDMTHDLRQQPKKSILKNSSKNRNTQSELSNYMHVRIDKYGNKIDDKKKQHICIDQEVVEHTVENWKELNQDMSQEHGCQCIII